MARSFVSSTSYNSTATITSSSAATLYPLANATTDQRRTKVWRSDGYWNITSANKTIIFRETTGVDLTATVSEDEYTTTTSFLAAVKSSLDTAGSSVYTVEQDATSKKIKITSDGAGGGGLLQLMWTNGSSAGFAGISGFSTGSDDTGALTYTADTLKIHTSESIVFDMGSIVNPKFFAAIGSRNENIQLTESAVIKVEGNATNDFSTPDFTTTLSYDQNTLVYSDSTGMHSVALRYWRLYIEDASNPNGYVELGHLQFSDAFVPTQASVQFPFTVNYVDMTKNMVSESGAIYSRQKPKTKKMILAWYPATITEKEDIIAIWDLYGMHTPFYITLDPDNVFSSTESIYSNYVRFDFAPTATLVSPGVYRINMNLKEEL